jgi:hypothetical protein
LTPQPFAQEVYRVPAQWSGVVPTFAENRLGISDGRALNGHLDVVPRRPWPVDGSHHLRLAVSKVLPIIASTVAQVDAPDIGHIAHGVFAVTKDDQLLVVRAQRSDAHVEQTLAARLFDLCPEASILLGAELELVEVRAPQQSAHVHTPSCGRSKDHPNLGALTVEPLIAIPPPVREHQEVAPTHLGHRGQQLAEVGRSVDQRANMIAH